MTNWNVDENGNRTFAHEEWTVRIWAADIYAGGRVNIESPNSGEEVEVNDEGIWVRGEYGGGWEVQPKSFTIPWAVIAAIIEARGIVEKEGSTQ